jgi:hypothetical protein
VNKDQLEKYLYDNYNLASDFRYPSSAGKVRVIDGSRDLLFPIGATEEEIDKIAISLGLTKNN